MDSSAKHVLFFHMCGQKSNKFKEATVKNIRKHSNKCICAYLCQDKIQLYEYILKDEIIKIHTISIILSEAAKTHYY